MPTRKDADQPRSFGERLKRAGIGTLFFLILLIPRIRRLRRRVRVWTAIRIVVGLAGLLLGWRFFIGGSGWFAFGSSALILFALLVRATPVGKSLDEMAREFGALVALNGGTLISENGEPLADVHIFTGVDRLTVVDGHRRRLGEIPTAKVQRCTVRPMEAGRSGAREGGAWELEIIWQAGNPQSARFRFDGFFAEHLARVAEATIRNLLRTELPILK